MSWVPSLMMEKNILCEFDYMARTEWGDWLGRNMYVYIRIYMHIYMHITYIPRSKRALT
jgi:hypothetical protein